MEGESLEIKQGLSQKRHIDMQMDAPLGAA